MSVAAVAWALTSCHSVPRARPGTRPTSDERSSVLVPTAPYTVLRRAPTELSWEQTAEGPLRPIVRVRVNGRIALALIDTGSSGSLLSASGARRLGVSSSLPAANSAGDTRPVDAATIQGLGAAVTGSIGHIAELVLGKIAIANVPVGITDALTLEYRPGRHVELWVGCDVLRAIGQMKWDGPRRRIVLAPTDSTPRGWEWLALHPSVGIPITSAVLDGDRRLWVAFDTGGDFDLWVSGPLSRQLDLPPPDTERSTPRMTGLGGRVRAYPVGHVVLRIGAREWPRVQVLVGATGHGHAHLPFALLGNGILEREVIWFDFQSGRIGLSPASAQAHGRFPRFFSSR